MIGAVVFDVGETLVDETRVWSLLARAAGVTPLTLAGLLGVELPESCDPLCAASACFISATKSALWVSGIGVTSTAVPQSL